MGRKRDIKKLSQEERLEKRKAILDALAKASEDSRPLDESASVRRWPLSSFPESAVLLVVLRF